MYYILISAIILFPVFILLFLARSISPERLNFLYRIYLTSALRKWERYLNGIPEDERKIVKKERLYELLNPIEKFFVKKIFAVDPASLGFKGPYYDEGFPENIKKIDSIKLGDGRETGVQFAPDRVYKDFMSMQTEIYKELGQKIYIDSGFRSSGRQTYLFIKYLADEKNFNLAENARWSAMPGYSEHGHPVNTAVDITTENGINGFSGDQTPQDFEATKEYKWLLENAKKFNFQLSYPKDNPHGVGFEPWHWRWKNFQEENS